MIKLYGIRISNYASTAKVAFLEKGVPFEEVSVMPSSKPEVLALSPMGKVPYIEVDGVPLSETNVIFDYLEDVVPEPALYPADPLDRAKVKEIIRTAELYLDLPARRHLAAAYFGAPVNEAAHKEVRPALEKGLRALGQLAKFSPHVAGEDFTFADIAVYFQTRFARMNALKVYDWDITGDVPGLQEYLSFVGDRPSVKKVDGEMQAALEALASK